MERRKRISITEKSKFKTSCKSPRTILSPGWRLKRERKHYVQFLICINVHMFCTLAGIKIIYFTELVYFYCCFFPFFLSFFALKPSPRDKYASEIISLCHMVFLRLPDSRIKMVQIRAIWGLVFVAEETRISWWRWGSYVLRLLLLPPLLFFPSSIYITLSFFSLHLSI